MERQAPSSPELAFSDRRDRCMNLLSREMEKERVPKGTREWLMALIGAVERGVRPRTDLAPNGWRYPDWRQQRPRDVKDMVEAQRFALNDVTEIALRAAQDSTCPAPVAGVIHGWIEEMHRRFDVVSAAR